ncbi:MAG: thioredoxin [Candidatus Dependentiae bacterium]
MAISITNENFKNEIESEQGPIVIDVFASWCGPCQQMEPLFEELEEELGESYKFAKINVDDARDISIKYGVTSVPTFLFIKGGEIKGKETGYMSKEDLKTKMQSYLG